MYFVSHVLFSLYLTAPDIVAMEEEEEAREEEPPPPEEEEEVFGGSIGQCSYCNYLFFLENGGKLLQIPGGLDDGGDAAGVAGGGSPSCSSCGMGGSTGERPQLP